MAAFLLGSADDEACRLLGTRRGTGAIVREATRGDGFSYEATIDSRRCVGLGWTDVDAARALLLACGYDPR